MNNNPKTKIENIVVQEFDNEVLIYDLSSNKAFCLNQTSAIVWNLCDGKHSVEQMSRILSQKMNQPITEDLIWLALDQFKRDGLLENEQFEINFGGLSRRQVIKKIGFASMVMLPLILSVVAPSAAMAQSGGIQLFGACPTGTGCAVGLTCIACSGCSSPRQCCVPSNETIVHGSGDLLFSCTSTSACNQEVINQCCSGMGFLQPDPSCQQFGADGKCFCS